MKYLLGWIYKLTRTEIQTFLELQKMQNPEHFEALQKYLLLVHGETLSESENNESDDESELNNQPTATVTKMIPVTPRQNV